MVNSIREVGCGGWRGNAGDEDDGGGRRPPTTEAEAFVCLLAHRHQVQALGRKSADM